MGRMAWGRGKEEPPWPAALFIKKLGNVEEALNTLALGTHQTHNDSAVGIMDSLKNKTALYPWILNLWGEKILYTEDAKW